ncbi:MAG TPA: MFS transporter [Gammaproteobacteria bacterium]|nr:MFS transporter [Gammaproteobacteria bacterium]
MDSIKNNLSHSKTNKLINPWLICFLGSLFFFYEFVQMNMFNALSIALMQAFAINATQLGNLSACYFYALILMLVPVGIFLDHFETKKLILVSMMVSMLGTFFLSMTTNLHLAQVCRFVSGLGGAFAFQSCLRLIAENFPSKRLALVNGCIVTFAMLGGIVAQTPLTLLVQIYDWRTVLWMYVGMGLFFYLFILIGLPNTANFHKKKDSLTSRAQIKNKIKLAVYNRQTWLAGIYTSLLNLPVPVLGAVWGSGFIIHVHQVSKIAAANIVSMLFVGLILGSPLFGWVSDHFEQRRTPMLIGALGALTTILIIVLLPSLSTFKLGVLFLLLGFFCSTEVLGYAVVAESNPMARGTALGIACLIIMCTGALAQPFFGWILDLHSNAIMINQVKTYPAVSYCHAMFILPIAFFISLVAASLLRNPFSLSKNP